MQLLQLRAERKVSNAQSALAYYFKQETLSNPNFSDLNPACIRAIPRSNAHTLPAGWMTTPPCSGRKQKSQSLHSPPAPNHGWRCEPGAGKGLPWGSGASQMGRTWWPGVRHIRQRRQSCQRDPGAGVRNRRRKHATWTTAPGSLLLAFPPQAKEGPRPPPVDLRSRWRNCGAA